MRRFHGMARKGHCAVSIDGTVLMWGAETMRIYTPATIIDTIGSTTGQRDSLAPSTSGAISPAVLTCSVYILSSSTGRVDCREQLAFNLNVCKHDPFE